MRYCHRPSNYTNVKLGLKYWCGEIDNCVPKYIHGQKTKCIYVLRNNDYLAYLSKHVCLLLKKVQDVLWPVQIQRSWQENTMHIDLHSTTFQCKKSFDKTFDGICRELVTGKYLVLLKLQNYQKLIFRKAQFV